MRVVNLNFISESSYSFWGSNAVMYYVDECADGSIRVINADPILPSLVATASHVHLEVTSQREKIVGLELVCAQMLQGQADVRLTLDPKLPFGI